MKKLVLILVTALMLLGACTIHPTKPAPQLMAEVEAKKEVQVTWVKINTPPGIEGPCYAYFEDFTTGNGGYGYSGIWCR